MITVNINHIGLQKCDLYLFEPYNIVNIINIHRNRFTIKSQNSLSYMDMFQIYNFPGYFIQNIIFLWLFYPNHSIDESVNLENKYFPG